jgi:ATP-dependent helicase HrpB
MANPLPPLPVDPFLPDILSAARHRRAVVVTAAPGAGKTTRVAPALAVDGPVLLLQPRRVAARAIARRIAGEQGWTIASGNPEARPASGRVALRPAGFEVGWQVRFEHRYGPRTRLLVATEGILTGRAQSDPLLSDFTTIVIDEFHERSLHGDLALALASQAWRARGDLRLVVMSATLESGPVAAYLDGCPVVDVPGRLHPLSVSYLPGRSMAEGLSRALGATDGQVLAFLPGAPEIRRAAAEIGARLAATGVDVVSLHGSLAADEQDDAIREVPYRRVILATNLAETSLTVPGVTAVVDSGLQKVARFDVSRAIDRLDTERIALDSATQRAGRAGRLAPGAVFRLWDERDRLRPSREPEIERVDLSGLVMDVLAWGGTPEDLEWFEPPPAASLDAAWTLLRRLGAVSGRRLTEVGRQVRRLPLPPRLARILVSAGGAPDAAAACAVLSGRFMPTGGSITTASDVLSALDRHEERPASFEHAVREIRRVAGLVFVGRPPAVGERGLLRALLAGYPDRVARRRAPGSPRVVLASGHGAVIGPESGVRDSEFLVAIDVLAADPAWSAGGRDAVGVEARIRAASAIERGWLEPTATRVDHRFDAGAGVVRAFQQDLYDRLVLGERQVEPDPERTAELLANAWLERGLSDGDRQLVTRMRFAGMTLDESDLVRRACTGCRTLAEASIGAILGHRERADVDRLAPAWLPLPSGRTARLEYTADGAVRAAVKLQELFGLADSPRLGPGRVPVQFALLAPNGRPVQVTQDLRSFWDNIYPDVRRALRARYPRHPWPEDPWSAPPTAGTTRTPRT